MILHLLYELVHNIPYSNTIATGLYDEVPPPRLMSDALSLGLKAFESMHCPVGSPPECIFIGGRIDYGTFGEAVCPLCGIQSNIMEFDSSPQFDENDQIIVRAILSKTGAKRGRETSRALLIDKMALFELSANAQAEAIRVYEEMLTRGYHLGGTGLKAVVNASVYHATRFDYNFMSMERIIGKESTMKKKVNGLMKRLRRDKVILRILPDPLATLNSTLSKKPQSSAVTELARKYAQLHIPNLRPDIHASGALYKALHEVGNNSERRLSQSSVGDYFHMSRKNVSQGYKAINTHVTPKINPPSNEKVGLTAEQLKLLRHLR